MIKVREKMKVTYEWDCPQCNKHWETRSDYVEVYLQCYACGCTIEREDDRSTVWTKLGEGGREE